MKQSLCAHCKNCEEVKYDGFLCDCMGYLDNKSLEDGCMMFEDDGFVNPKTTKEENKMNDKHSSMSDMIATMALNGATKEELERVIKYSATVIDAERARTNLGIEELEKKYMKVKVDSKPKTYNKELDLVGTFFDRNDALIQSAPRNSLLGMLKELNEAMVNIEGHCVDPRPSDIDLKKAEAHITHVALMLAQMWSDENEDI